MCVQRLVKLVGAPSLLYSGPFLREYVPRLRDAAFATLLATKEAQLRDVNSDVLAVGHSASVHLLPPSHPLACVCRA